jgi:putative heme-binding domain-containing protein
MESSTVNVMRGLLVLIFALGCWVPISAQEPRLAIELPSTEIFSKGPNEIHDGVLEITRGRGAIIAWYVTAKETDEIVVSIEYSCTKPLNQEYQISFDGDNRFWEVEPTDADTWRRAELGTFRVRPGLPIYIQLTPPSGTKYEHPFRFSKLILKGSIAGNLERFLDYREPRIPDSNPGFGQKLAAVHPALTVKDLRAEDLTLRISGMAMRSERELIFTTWEGDLFSLDLDAVNGEGPPPFHRIAQGLSEPMGLAVEGNRIFVTEKNEATELLDADGDGLYETYRCLSHDWPSTLDYHEYLFGAVVQDSHLYFSSSTAMNTRGIDNRQAPLRGSVLKVHIDTGATEVVAGGLRTPDGIGMGPGGSILVTDNQGEWLPANKLIHVQPGAFYQFRSRRPWHPLDRARHNPPAVWLPQGEIAASPTEPILLPKSWGPYAGQVIFGDATFGGLQRVSLEEVDGIMQGAVFPFSQGFQHLFHRFVFSSDGDLFAGGIARGKDWEFIRRVSGLTRIKFNGVDVFEPLSTSLRSNGIEIEFTQPLAEGIGNDPEAYVASQWGYQATQTYGGSKIRHRRAEIRSATVSEDRKRVFLEIPNLVEDEVLHVRLSESLMSQTFHSLWSGEFWYTVNRIPKGNPGIVEKPIGTEVVGSIPYFSYSEGNAGRTLYRSYCSGCHSLDERKLVGPSFLEIVGAKRKVHDLETGKTRITKVDMAYLKQSILEPNALIVDGYAKDLMPPVGAYLTDSQIGELISYIKKVSNPKIAKLEAARPLATVRDWSTKDFPDVGERWTRENPNSSAITRGKQAFLKAQCLQCHVVSGIGASLGPDLVESVKTYRGTKLLKQIIEPSSELHPKYRTIQFLLESGNLVVGSIIKEDEESVYVATDLMLPQNLTKLSKDEIEQQKGSELSAMPQGLLNTLTKQEILDLLSFLESGVDSTMGLNAQAEKK